MSTKARGPPRIERRSEVGVLLYSGHGCVTEFRLDICQGDSRPLLEVVVNIGLCQPEVERRCRTVGTLFPHAVAVQR